MRTHSAFVAQDVLLRQTINKGSGFRALSSVILVDMDVICLGIFANVFGVIFASKSETAGFTDVNGATFNFCFCLRSQVGSFQCLLL